MTYRLKKAFKVALLSSISKITTWENVFVFHFKSIDSFKSGKEREEIKVVFIFILKVLSNKRRNTIINILNVFIYKLFRSSEMFLFHVILDFIYLSIEECTAKKYLSI